MVVFQNDFLRILVKSDFLRIRSFVISITYYGFKEKKNKILGLKNVKIDFRVPESV